MIRDKSRPRTLLLKYCIRRAKERGRSLAVERKSKTILLAKTTIALAIAERDQSSTPEAAVYLSVILWQPV
jgi:hypothetical protein